MKDLKAHVARLYANIKHRAEKAGQEPPNRHAFETWLVRILAKSKPRCPYCGESLPLGKASIDHRIPISRGGLSDLGNLDCICARCNRRKSALTAQEYGALLSFLSTLPPVASRDVLTRLAAGSGFVFRFAKR